MPPKDKKDDKLPSKALCKVVKDGFLKDYPVLFRKLVTDGRYFCRKCGRVAAKKKSLCKGEKL